MRTPSIVAKEIKQALKESGIAASARSRNYIVHVKADGSLAARQIAREIYHKESHAWLMVQVDNHYLPMPPIREEPPCAQSATTP
jgi:tRNA uridine 5-carbamoylmethylation protein Kti12